MRSTLILLLCYSVYSAPMDFTDMLGEKCQDAAEKIKLTQCAPMLTEFGQESMVIDPEAKVGDPKIVSLITLCKKLMICIEPTCLSETIKDTTYVTCTEIELRNTELGSCITKIEKEKPDMSKYTCMGPEDYKNGVIQLGMYTSNQECLRSVLKDYCGEKSIENYDADIQKAVKMAQVTQSIVIQLFAGNSTNGWMK
ncbi:hypothetical protein CAEBREN_06856 [Caenorhabditis brenneri]|uniref:T20D4.11-like domain-containing protein n=1 Tax=Caenorhabditis brenneri TaxID=135651 RepID=G0M9W8_CAEBE|nr:hypothetical protein CAEBREN_06856 [Caenorhabditis brenneri]